MGLASGCTAGDWRYESPPAAGVQTDEGTVKVRNLMVLADSEGEGLLLGSVFSTQPLDLSMVSVAGEQSDGTFAEPVAIDLSAAVPVNGSLILGDSSSRVEGADLLEGRVAKVMMQFSDGTTATIDAPVMSSTHPDYEEAWEKAQA